MALDWSEYLTIAIANVSTPSTTRYVIINWQIFVVSFVQIPTHATQDKFRSFCSIGVVWDLLQQPKGLRLTGSWQNHSY